MTQDVLLLSYPNHRIRVHYCISQLQGAFHANNPAIIDEPAPQVAHMRHRAISPKEDGGLVATRRLSGAQPVRIIYLNVQQPLIRSLGDFRTHGKISTFSTLKSQDTLHGSASQLGPGSGKIMPSDYVSPMYFRLSLQHLRTSKKEVLDAVTHIVTRWPRRRPLSAVAVLICPRNEREVRFATKATF